MTTNKKLQEWVKKTAESCQPDKIHWCDGSQEELQRLIDTMLEAGTIVPVPKRPGSYLAREAHGFNPGAGRIRMALVAETAECVEAAERIVKFVQSRT